MPLDEITPRELEVLRLIAAGNSTKEIAWQLGIAFKTAACHRSRVLNKFGVHNSVGVIREATRNGLLKAPATPNGEVEPPSDTALASRIQSTLEESRKNREMLRSSIKQCIKLRKECNSGWKGLRAESERTVLLMEQIRLEIDTQRRKTADAWQIPAGEQSKTISPDGGDGESQPPLGRSAAASSGTAIRPLTAPAEN